MTAWIPPVWSPFSLGDVVRSLMAGETAVTALEAHLRKRFEAGDAVATASGTHALQVAIGLGLDAGGSVGAGVALPAYGCFDLVTAAVATAAPVRFYDLYPSTLSPDPESLRRAARESSVVVVANLYGHPLDWDAIRDAGGDAVVVEDAAQGVGSEWRGRRSGTFGDLTVLSFGRGKGWTGGGGGALLVRQDGLGDPRTLIGPPVRRRVRTAAVSAASWLLARPGLYALPARAPLLDLGETVYRPPAPAAAAGCFNAGLALASRQASQAEVDIRRRHAEELRERLTTDSAPMSLPRPVPEGRSSYLRLPALAPSAWTGRDLRVAGVYRGYPRALPELLAVRPLLAEGAAAVPTGTAELVERLVTLPTHSRSDPARVVALLQTLLE